MALLLRTFGRQCLLRQAMSGSLMKKSLPMPALASSSAYEDMKVFWAKNRELKRPLSPHLSIYAKQLTAVLSLFHRATGIAMALAVSTASITLLIAPGDFPTYIEFVRGLHIPAALIIGAKCFISWPIVYHYLNGIRHLAWDAALGCGLTAIYRTGYFVFILAILVTLKFALQ